MSDTITARAQEKFYNVAATKVGEYCVVNQRCCGNPVGCGGYTFKSEYFVGFGGLETPALGYYQSYTVSSDSATLTHLSALQDKSYRVRFIQAVDAAAIGVGTAGKTANVYILADSQGVGSDAYIKQQSYAYGNSVALQAQNSPSGPETEEWHSSDSINIVDTPTQSSNYRYTWNTHTWTYDGTNDKTITHNDNTSGPCTGSNALQICTHHDSGAIIARIDQDGSTVTEKTGGSTGCLCVGLCGAVLLSPSEFSWYRDCDVVCIDCIWGEGVSSAWCKMTEYTVGTGPTPTVPSSEWTGTYLYADASGPQFSCEISAMGINNGCSNSGSESRTYYHQDIPGNPASPYQTEVYNRSVSYSASGPSMTVEVWQQLYLILGCFAVDDTPRLVVRFVTYLKTQVMSTEQGSEDNTDVQNFYDSGPSLDTTITSDGHSEYTNLLSIIRLHPYQNFLHTFKAADWPGQELLFPEVTVSSGGVVVTISE